VQSVIAEPLKGTIPQEVAFQKRKTDGTWNLSCRKQSEMEMKERTMRKVIRILAICVLASLATSGCIDGG